MGALIAGTETPAAKIVAGIAESQFGGSQASILVRGSKTSASGAALANGFAANALDIDDGYRLVKGHPGACVLPVILTAAELTPACTGGEFLTALIIGYELGIRAGRIRHACYETYHSSGSWGAIAGAAAAGRIMGLNAKILRHALGAAEYHAPIAPMMKGIETPSMGKDSIGWGAMVGMLSVLMAGEGFTGIEPLFSDAPHPEWIENLGCDWQILNLYFKPYAACRWAQPAVDGALKIKAERGIAPFEIKTIRIRSFEAACALSTRPPANTEDAQYNMAYPVAVALIDGEVGPSSGAASEDLRSRRFGFAPKNQHRSGAGLRDRIPGQNLCGSGDRDLRWEIIHLGSHGAPMGAARHPSHGRGVGSKIPLACEPGAGLDPVRQSGIQDLGF